MIEALQAFQEPAFFSAGRAPLVQAFQTDAGSRRCFDSYDQFPMPDFQYRQARLKRETGFPVGLLYQTGPIAAFYKRL